MSYNLQSKPKIDYWKVNEGLNSSLIVEIFMQAKKSSDVMKESEQGACGGADEDSELLHFKELLAAEEKTRENLKVKEQQRKEAERKKEKDRLRARLDKVRAENKALAHGSKQDKLLTAVNSTDLRSFESLARDVEKQLGKMGLAEHKPTDSSTDSDSSSSDQGDTTRHNSRRRRGKKLKSGKTAKVVSKVVRPQIWPQSDLSLSYVSKDVRYDDLSIEEFVAGYSSILALRSIAQKERQARVEHLTNLMYLANVYEWSAVRGFYAAVLMEIERGCLNWGDSFTSLETRAMAGCSKQVTSVATSKEQKRNAPTFYFVAIFSVVRVRITRIIMRYSRAKGSGFATFVLIERDRGEHNCPN